MRELLLIGIVTITCLCSFITPQVGVLGYVWFNLMRPDFFAWSTIQFGLALGICALVGSVRYVYRISSLFANPISLGLILFQIPVALSIVFAQRVDLALTPYNKFVKVIITALLIPLTVDGLLWFHRLILVTGFSIGMVALKFGLFSLVHGGIQLTAGFGGFLGDTNGLALAMAMAMPLCWYCRYLVRPFWAKMMYLGMSGMALATIGMTGSRGNMIAVAVIALLLVFRSKYKLVALAGIVLLALPTTYFGGGYVLERLQTLEDIETDESAYSRVEFAKAALKMWRDHPIFGVGYGELNYVRLHSRYLGRADVHVAHNTYLQTLADCGLPATLIYVSLLFGTIFWLGASARRMKRLRPGYEFYPYALEGPLIVFAIGSTFYSRGDFEFLYIVLMSAAAWYHLEKQLLAEQPAAPPEPSQEAVPTAGVTVGQGAPGVIAYKRAF